MNEKERRIEEDIGEWKPNPLKPWLPDGLYDAVR
jgi:hypothetical protein